MEEVNLAVDLGSSLTKAVWSRHPLIPCHFLTLEPEVLSCGAAYLNAYRSKRVNFHSTAKEDLWLKLNKNDADAYVLGFLAQALLADVNLKALKCESALYKILAVLGVIAEQEERATSFSVNLAILLPWSEWSDRQQLQEQVKKALRSFWFRGTHYRISLKNWKTLPEGAGVSACRCERLSSSTTTVATLVFGHRNTSCLIFKRGRLIEGNTTNLGFYRLVEQVLDLTSGQESNPLTQVIYQLGNPVNLDNSLIGSLCKLSQPENREQEAQGIAEAIAQAQQNYWGLLSQWLRAKVPEEVDEIIVAGGAAKYLYVQLCQYFSGVQAYWGTDWQEQIENHPDFQSLDLHQRDRESLAYRLVDAFAYHQLQLKSLQRAELAPAASL